MLNNSVLSFYDDFGLIFTGSKYKATNGIENCMVAFDHPTVNDASSRETRSEYPHKLPQNKLC